MGDGVPCYGALEIVGLLLFIIIISPSTANISYQCCEKFPVLTINRSIKSKPIYTVPCVAAFPPEDWKRPPGCPWITWKNTVLNDLESHNLKIL